MFDYQIFFENLVIMLSWQLSNHPTIEILSNLKYTVTNTIEAVNVFDISSVCVSMKVGDVSYIADFVNMVKLQ